MSFPIRSALDLLRFAHDLIKAFALQCERDPLDGRLVPLGMFDRAGGVDEGRAVGLDLQMDGPQGEVLDVEGRLVDPPVSTTVVPRNGVRSIALIGLYVPESLSSTTCWSLFWRVGSEVTFLAVGPSPDAP